MSKQDFLNTLRVRLSGLPKGDIEERLVFYSEIIDDRTDEGVSEEEAISEVGSIDEIVNQIIAETPLLKITAERIKPKRRIKAWEIVFLSLGSPIWLSLCISAIAVFFSLFVCLFSVVITFWSIFLAFLVSPIYAVAQFVISAISGDLSSGLLILSAGIAAAALAILFFFVCKSMTKGTLLLVKKAVFKLKICFVGKETEQ